ncbi:hypothetical protein Patl1_30857 [Pistacia atlantica]|uniref:Uncharacterized protein n=1 Tax=Pistacia atlantica TaxID=434234 RepID=A0ACC1A899_9ROSI|nr:hypothetical protein Patl1_30857 [Pistacia atlantica]
MDRTGRHSPDELCGLIWRSTMGLYSKSFRNSLVFLHFVYLIMTACRWSRIARKLPGRTDNEIKNYWRTHMRKKAQERKRGVCSPPSSSFSNISSPSSTVTTVDSMQSKTGKASFYDTGGRDGQVMGMAAVHEENETAGYSMDDIWKDIELSEENNSLMIRPVCEENTSNFSCASIIASPSWDYPWYDSLWRIDDFEEESKMINNLPNDQFISSSNEYGKAYLTG